MFSYAIKFMYMTNFELYIKYEIHKINILFFTFTQNTKCKTLNKKQTETV